jgi:hypothetical protein
MTLSSIPFAPRITPMLRMPQRMPRRPTAG